MLCPRCRSERCRRSKRRRVKDFIIGALDLRPWRCRNCDLRFYANVVAMPYLFTAHCGRCGNFDVQRIAAKHGKSRFAWLFRLAQVPVYRCNPCRERFFSVRPHRVIRSIEAEEDISAQSQPVSG